MAKKTLTVQQVVDFLNTTNGRALKTDVVAHFLSAGVADVKINHISGVCWNKNGPLRSEGEFISLSSLPEVVQVKPVKPVKEKAQKEPKEKKPPKAPAAKSKSKEEATESEGEASGTDQPEEGTGTETGTEVVGDVAAPVSDPPQEEPAQAIPDSILANFVEFGKKDGMPYYKHAARNLFLHLNDRGLITAQYVFKDSSEVSSPEPSASVREALGMLIDAVGDEMQESDDVSNTVAFLHRVKRKM